MIFILLAFGLNQSRYKIAKLSSFSNCNVDVNISKMQFAVVQEDKSHLSLFFLDSSDSGMNTDHNIENRNEDITVVSYYLS